MTKCYSQQEILLTRNFDVSFMTEKTFIYCIITANHRAMLHSGMPYLSICKKEEIFLLLLVSGRTTGFASCLQIFFILLGTHLGTQV